MDRKSILITALRDAGRAILKYDPSLLEAETKTTAGDLVTAADIASESTIIKIIRQSFPDELIISEESKTGQELLNDQYLQGLTCWVIDPIDGTNNYKRGMAYSGISLGFIVNGEIVLGGILDPYRNNMYIAEKGRGATCNNTTIHVSNRTKFDPGTRVCTSNSYEGGTQDNLNRYQKLGHVWVDVLGSAVLIMADIASGKLDLYHHNGLKPWDNAAGFLIADEAGAKICGLTGQKISWLSNEAIIGNPTLVDEFLRKISSA